MATYNLAERVATLEAEVLRLREQLERSTRKDWHRIVGTFANDPAYEEAMRLGRQWRESFRPMARKKPKKKKVSHGRARHGSRQRAGA